MYWFLCLAHLISLLHWVHQMDLTCCYCLCHCRTGYFTHGWRMGLLCSVRLQRYMNDQTLIQLLGNCRANLEDPAQSLGAI